MLELAVWAVCGVVTGWVGYLATRSEKSRRISRYLFMSLLGAITGGLLTRGVSREVGFLAQDGASTMAAILGSVIGVVAAGISGSNESGEDLDLD